MAARASSIENRREAFPGRDRPVFDTPVVRVVLPVAQRLPIKEPYRLLLFGFLRMDRRNSETKDDYKERDRSKHGFRDLLRKWCADTVNDSEGLFALTSCEL